MPTFDSPAEDGEWPYFYNKEEYRKLLELLAVGAKRSQERKAKYYPGDRSEASTRASRERRVLELDSAARDTLAEFTELRNGELDQRIKLVKALPKLMNDLESNVQKLKPVLENFGPSLNEDALKLLERARLAAQFYEQCHGAPPGGIKSEGQHHSHNLASACLNRFLVVVCVTWFQGTSELIRISYWEGPFARFAKAAVEPFVNKINSDRPGLVPTDWKSLAQRIKRLKLEKHDLLTPVFEKRSAVIYKKKQRLTSNRTRQARLPRKNVT